MIPSINDLIHVHMKLSLSFIFLLTSILLVAGQSINYGNNKQNGKYYHVRDIDFYIEQYGNGENLILLHGNGGSIHSMSSIIPYFSNKYHVIAIDSRAHGKTIDLADSLSFEMMADDVSALLSALKVNTTYVLGWSDGGIIALELALRHPQQIKKLVSSGANIWPDSSAILPSLWLHDQHYYDSMLNRKKETAAEKKSWKYFLLDWEQPHIDLKALHQITTPSLIVSGDKDVIRLEHTLLIYQNIPGANLWVLPNCGHGTLIQYPQEFFNKVDTFFSEKKKRF